MEIIKKKGYLTGFTLIEVMITVIIIAILSAIAIPNFLKGANTARKEACIGNLMKIDAAKEQYALDYNLSSGASVTDAQINTYMKGGAPSCPSDGTYTYGNIGTDPTCSLKVSKGHEL